MAQIGRSATLGLVAAMVLAAGCGSADATSFGGTSGAGGSTGGGLGASKAGSGAVASAGGAAGSGTGSPGGAASSQGGASSSAGGAASSQGGEAAGRLVITPANATFSPPASVGLSANYTAHISLSGSPDMDVTSVTTFTLSPPTFGAFAGATLTAPAGEIATATINAAAEGLTASTTVSIAASPVVIGPGADGGSAAKFGGVTGGAGPQIVYPSPGVILPPNLNSFEFHFVPAAAETLFQLTFQSPMSSLTVYTGCTPVGAGCVYTPDATFWTTLANSLRGGPAVSLTIAGVNGASPGQVGVSKPQTLQFSNNDIHGGIYYWNVAGAIERYDFGMPGTPPETYLDAPEAGALFCVGCHAISRNGERIVVGLDIPAPAPYKVFEVGSKALDFSNSAVGENFFAFNPDGTQLLVSNGVTIGLEDALTGAPEAASILPSGFYGTMPDWSPDGSQIVYGSPQTPPPFGFPSPTLASGSIMILPVSDGAFGNPTTLVPFAGQNNYYPSFSADGQWIVYNVSPSNNDSFSNAAAGDAGAPDGELWAVSTAGGTPIRLSNATQAGDSWPKWAPEVDQYAGGPIEWMTFSSWRQYGLRLSAGTQAQLWMVGFDPAKAALGQDPTVAAFWLPFQDITSGNRIAQWVTQVLRQ